MRIAGVVHSIQEMNYVAMVNALVVQAAYCRTSAVEPKEFEIILDMTITNSYTLN